ncbi:MAG: N-acetyl-alpha-D-glucosaminyl L-malate synthase [Syntrophomonadaceae bacterium]|nr:N-acetyl-alpha-D-glucosaminyl L-malate synthase [Bacillota bacterium]
MRIAFIATCLKLGGAETQLVRLAVALKKRGWRVGVISMQSRGAFAEELGEAGIALATLNMRRGVPDPRALIGLSKILSQWQPEVVHSHMVHANLLARVARLFCKIPVLVCTAHSISEGGRWREIAYRLTDPLADITTNVSRAAVARYIQAGVAPRGKIVFIPNGVDTETFKPNEAAGRHMRDELSIGEGFVWLAAGRFEAAKDYPNMLRAFKEVVLKRPDAVLLLAGQGSLLEETKNIADELGLKNKVRFLGVRRDVPEIMNTADGYVMSSAWEGLPMVLLEAAACSSPIVATDVGGNSEVVLNEESGYIVPSRDTGALAGAMLRLTELPETERKRMGEAGRAHIEAHYSLERVVDRWEELYKELLQRKGEG